MADASIFISLAATISALPPHGIQGLAVAVLAGKLIQWLGRRACYMAKYLHDGS
ncbi:MAG: hypothetical protein ACPGGK_06850 [Pikeienuella sp.]